MGKHTATKIGAAIICVILCLTIIGIPIAVIIAQLNSIIELLEGKQ